MFRTSFRTLAIIAALITSTGSHETRAQASQATKPPH